ncbi:MAG TPA: LysR substrate-binding domain-containing protein [Beijerinckiaceae bacterium]|nr:LysR substrate-binding domain-containing protein [Beijerinckiaceae bacterium]
MQMLDLDQLRSLIAIADSGSFTRAAEIVCKTQSAVSMQMKRLEDQLARPIFAKEGRGTRLTEDGQRLLSYARRMVQINGECLATFADAVLTGRVRLGVPDDYADRYLPEILARFTRMHPKVEVTVVCEATPMLVERMQAGDLDLAIITLSFVRDLAEAIRHERLLWVTSAHHSVHEQVPVPLALGRPNCAWRMVATERLEAAGKPFRVLYASWNSAAVGAAVMSGLAVGVLPESAVRSGMRVLGPSDGFPPLPEVKIALLRSKLTSSAIIDALATQIVQSLDNLSGSGVAGTTL